MDLEQRKAKAADLRGREVRHVSATVETRSDDGGQTVFEGYASTTERGYDMGWYTETIKRGAFTKTLSESPDVQLLMNHGGLPLARTTNGTLDLREDDRGLWFRATSDADDPTTALLASKVDKRLMDQCSFAFRVTRQSWDEDYENRDITEVSLDRGDVSIVNYGANPTTPVTVSMRALMADAGLSLPVLVAAFGELRSGALTDPSVDALARVLGWAADGDDAAEQGRLALSRLMDERADGSAEQVEVDPERVLDLYRARAFALRLRG